MPQEPRGPFAQMIAWYTVSSPSSEDHEAVRIPSIQWFEATLYVLVTWSFGQVRLLGRELRRCEASADESIPVIQCIIGFEFIGYLLCVNRFQFVREAPI
jgi:hypothetical protein